MDRSSPPGKGLTPGQGGSEKVATGAGRNLAASLDSLIRSVRTNPGAVPNLIERILGYWQESEHKTLEILPTGMPFDQNMVFSAEEEEEGRWLLPELQVDLGAFETRVDGGAFVIPTDEHERLQDLCVDPIFWAEARPMLSSCTLPFRRAFLHSTWPIS